MEYCQARLYMTHANPTNPGLSETLLIAVSSASGILACVGDPLMTYVLGKWYAGYQPLLQPMSDLGRVGSPVAFAASIWWAILGLLFACFGYGFYRAFWRQGAPARKAAIMIALYGLGEGLGSGLVPESPGTVRVTTRNLLHDFCGAVGVLALVSVPFIVMTMYNAKKSRYLHGYSWFTSIAGIFFLLLFAVSWLFGPQGTWIAYAGLWQRLFMLTYYLFMTYLVVLMLTRRT